MPGAAAVDAGVAGLVGDSSSRGETARGMGMASGSGSAPRTVGGPVELTALVILESDLGGTSCAANEDLWEVEAVASPRVRAMT